MHTIQGHIKNSRPSSKDWYQVKAYSQGDVVPPSKSKNGLAVKPTLHKKRIIKNRNQPSILRELSSQSKVGRRGGFLSEEVAMLVDQLLDGMFRNAQIARRNMSPLQGLEYVANEHSFLQKTLVHAEVVDVEPREPIVLTLTQEEVQKRRDEVREMVQQGKPKEGIELYPGKIHAPDAVAFFKTNYKNYIVPRQEVIFASELMSIDAPLIRALRNECRNPSTPMPIGTVEDRTIARNAGRFFDGHASVVSTKSAMARKAKRVLAACRTGRVTK